MGSTTRDIPATVRLTRRVIEALPQDAGRGIVRLDPKDIETLGCRIGDTVSLAGKRTTVARVMPAHAEFRGRDLVLADGILRENAQAGLDARVELAQVAASPARQLVLEAGDARRTGSSRDIGRLCEGLPVMGGDRLRARLPGAAFRDFRVVETSPSGPVLIAATTRIRMATGEPPADSRARVSYEDIGGLHKEVRRVRELIELPLRYPQIFERLGIQAPKGILLCGPPGCGKTLIARAVAAETEAHFIRINGPEIIHKFYGESEARLRQIFEEAGRRAPAILFLDEIDAIAPRRAETVGDVEKRVVAQLLALMDGLEDRGQVVVIAATNIPHVLDPALRRPGRFDRELTITVPDQAGRLEILQIHTGGMPLAESVSLERLAAITHGFVGADLEALCREAAMNAVRDLLPAVQWERAEIPEEALLNLQVTQAHFDEALREVEPSAIRDVAVEVAAVHWEDVGGLEDIKQQLIRAVEWPGRYPELFARARVRPPRGILLYGPPGTGKTLLAKAVATAGEANFLSVKGPELFSKWVGESEKGIREIFRKARQVAPSIVFFDEIDALAALRGQGQDSGVTARVIAQLLTELDGIEERGNVVVIAATNRVDILDPALLRAGRFDLLLELPLPDRSARLAILDIHSRGRPLAGDVDLAALSDRLAGWAGANLAALCDQAALMAIEECLEAGIPPEQLSIRAFHFEQALSRVLKPE